MALSTNQAAALFAQLASHIATASQSALEQAAVIIETEAKTELGTYQGPAGPFAGWSPLAPITQAQRVAQGYSPNDPGLRSGDMRDSIEHTVQMFSAASGQAEIGSNDPNMLYFELGTSKQPPRSALGAAAFRKEAEVRQLLGNNISATIAGVRVI